MRRVRSKGSSASSKGSSASSKGSSTSSISKLLKENLGVDDDDNAPLSESLVKRGHNYVGQKYKHLTSQPAPRERGSSSSSHKGRTSNDEQDSMDDIENELENMPLSVSLMQRAHNYVAEKCKGRLKPRKPDSVQGTVASSPKSDTNVRSTSPSSDDDIADEFSENMDISQNFIAKVHDHVGENNQNLINQPQKPRGTSSEVAENDQQSFNNDSSISVIAASPDSVQLFSATQLESHHKDQTEQGNAEFSVVVDNEVSSIVKGSESSEDEDHQSNLQSTPQRPGAHLARDVIIGITPIVKELPGPKKSRSSSKTLKDSDLLLSGKKKSETAIDEQQEDQTNEIVAVTTEETSSILELLEISSSWELATPKKTSNRNTVTFLDSTTPITRQNHDQQTNNGFSVVNEKGENVGDVTMVSHNSHDDISDDNISEISQGSSVFLSVPDSVEESHHSSNRKSDDDTLQIDTRSVSPESVVNEISLRVNTPVDVTTSSLQPKSREELLAAALERSKTIIALDIVDKDIICSTECQMSGAGRQLRTCNLYPMLCLPRVEVPKRKEEPSTLATPTSSKSSDPETTTSRPKIQPKRRINTFTVTPTRIYSQVLTHMGKRLSKASSTQSSMASQRSTASEKITSEDLSVVNNNIVSDSEENEGGEQLEEPVISTIILSHSNESNENAVGHNSDVQNQPNESDNDDDVEEEGVVVTMQEDYDGDDDDDVRIDVPNSSDKSSLKHQRSSSNLGSAKKHQVSSDESDVEIGSNNTILNDSSSGPAKRPRTSISIHSQEKTDYTRAVNLTNSGRKQASLLVVKAKVANNFNHSNSGRVTRSSISSSSSSQSAGQKGISSQKEADTTTSSSTRKHLKRSAARNSSSSSDSESAIGDENKMTSTSHKTQLGKNTSRQVLKIIASKNKARYATGASSSRKGKKKTLEEWQDNSDMISKADLIQVLPERGLKFSNSEILSFLNKQLERFCNGLCKQTSRPYGLFSYRQLEDALKQKKLIDPSLGKNGLLLMIASILDHSTYEAAKGILIPRDNEYDTYHGE